jgi:hypothetical protein
MLREKNMVSQRYKYIPAAGGTNSRNSKKFPQKKDSRQLP